MLSMKQISGAAALGAVLLTGSGLLGRGAQAGYIVTLQEVGGNVVATGSGPIDLTGLTLLAPIVNASAGIFPSSPSIGTGPVGANVFGALYAGVVGPTSFGSGGFQNASSGSGNPVGIEAFQGVNLQVPSNYSSGSLLSDTSTYLNQSFLSLGVTPGTYEWT
jgi:hypothetical protein